MRKLEFRIERLEEKLSYGPNDDVIMVLPGDNEEEMLREYQQQNPGQPLPGIIRINFVKAKSELCAQEMVECWMSPAWNWISVIKAEY